MALEQIKLQSITLCLASSKAASAAKAQYSVSGEDPGIAADNLLGIRYSTIPLCF